MTPGHNDRVTANLPSNDLDGSLLRCIENPRITRPG